MSARDALATALRQAAIKAKDTTGHRLLWTGLAGLLIGLTVLTVVIIMGYRMIGELKARADANATAAQTLADQIRSSGGTPVIQPPVRLEQGPAGPPSCNGATATLSRDWIEGQLPINWIWIDVAGCLQFCTRDTGSHNTAPAYTCTTLSLVSLIQPEDQ